MLWLILILFLIAPALALENLSTSDFRLEYKVLPEKDCYLPDETLNVSYTIYPRNEELRVAIGGDKDNPRTYTFETTLLDAKWMGSISYYGAAEISLDGLGKKFELEVKYFYIDEERKGISKIEVNLKGKVSQFAARLADIKILEVKVENIETLYLQPAKIYVANKTAFQEDISKARKDISEIREKLKAEGLDYGEEISSVEKLIEEASTLLGQEKYVDADKKLSLAEENITKLSQYTEKDLAEKLYQSLKEALSKASQNLEEASLLLQKIDNETLRSRYVEIKSKYSDLGKALDKIEGEINENKFSKAYQDAKSIEKEVYELLNSSKDLLNELSLQQKGFGFEFSLNLFSPLVAVLLAAVIAVVAIAIFAKKFRRRKWDELR